VEKEEPESPTEKQSVPIKRTESLALVVKSNF